MNQTNYAANKETIRDSLFSFRWQTCARKLLKPLPEYMKCIGTGMSLICKCAIDITSCGLDIAGNGAPFLHDSEFGNTS